MSEHAKAPPPVIDGRMTIAEVGARRIANLARKGRQPDTTLSNYEADIRLHFAPFFGETPVDGITVEEVEEFIDRYLDDELRAARDQRPLKVSTVAKLYAHLSGIFDCAIRKRWCSADPYKEVDKPGSAEEDEAAEIRALSTEELDAILALAGAGRCRHTPGHSRAPNSRGRCATWRGCQGRMSPRGWSARRRPRFTFTGRRLRRSSRMISRGSSGCFT